MIRKKRPKYLMMDRDRVGNERWYFRRFGVKTRLPGPPGSPGFDVAYAHALANMGHTEPQNRSRPVVRIDKMHEKSGYIYFLRSGSTVKIGFSKTPGTRLQGLQTGMSTEVRMAVIVQGSVYDEKRLHNHFAHYRLSGEWFRAERPILDAIELAVKTGRTEGAGRIPVPRPADPVQRRGQHVEIIHGN